MGLLDGIRVIEVGQFMSAPFCGMLLGDMGADVIKIERPGLGDETRRQGPPFLGGFSAYFLSNNRNKRSLTLNLQSDDGKRIFLELARTSSVIVENNRPGVMAKLGLDYQTVQKENPEIVYCSISGYGQDGPYAGRGGYDQVIQGLSGLMSITGEEGGRPVKVGVAITDLVAGIYAFSAVLAGLYHKEMTGKGTFIDVSMLDCAISLLTFQAQKYFITGVPPTRLGTRHPLVAPYQAFRVKDGYLNISAGNDKLFQALCRALGLEELTSDPRFRTNVDRVQNMGELARILEAELVKKDAATWERLLTEEGIPCGPIYDLSQVFSDPQVVFRQMVLEVELPGFGTHRQVGFPVKFGRWTSSIRKPPPSLGQHSEEILKTLGYDDDTISAYKQRGVI